MIILPAIDLRGGQAVRLVQGDYDKMTVYSSEPSAQAEKFKAAGAEHIHIVDLDGAKDAFPVNFGVIKDILNCGLKAEIGGGIRGEREIEQYLSLGAERVILGTAAVENFALVENSVKKYGGKIAVGVDAKDGFVAVKGWREVTDVKSLDFCKKLADAGVQTVIYTDISKDGMLCGSNIEIYRELVKIEGLDIIASGGVSSLEEIAKLKLAGVYGAIVGKAIYSGKLDLSDAIKAALL